MKTFLSPTFTSVKICGITRGADADLLANLGVDALGVNFWPQSRRYCDPEMAKPFLHEVAGRILRVGVFVNNSRPLGEELFRNSLIDVVQLHGDETSEDIQHFLEQGIPVIRAVSAENLPQHDLPKENFALLIDTPAGKEYGGTGRTFDWSIARTFREEHPDIPIILAGGLTPENAEEAIKQVQPVAIDVASGAEESPGIKDSKKVRAFLDLIKL
ncbi:phosphoribosylanthranilate isomerase [Akkermansiaceae bacterium]|nr:phosphoribosylanthranilate isomerase [Akkermansiaceae bacterium]